MLKKVILDNGLRIVCEKIPYVRSLSIGIWVGTGSRNEHKDNNGISHFIEHMLFKGTSKRNAREIAECIDNIGGQLNAFTGKECTCYYAKTLDSHVNIAVDVLSDMFFNSRFKKKDIDVEKKVIIGEINMYEDSPEELVHDMLSKTVWDGDPLGYPILGTYDCLKSINRENILEYTCRNYTPHNSVIAVAGNCDDGIIGILDSYFGKWETEKGGLADYNPVKFIKNNRVREKDIEQVHMCIGFNGIEHGRDELYTLLVINNVLGGGMSSRLFQKIREEKGLAYSIYSYPSSYKNAGLFTIYAGMNPDHLNKVVNLIMDEIKLIVKNGLNSDELQKSKEQLKGNYILGLESTSSRMNSIGKSELMLGYINPPEEILKKIDNVSPESVDKVIKQVFNIDNMSLSVIGNIKKDINLEKIIAN